MKHLFLFLSFIICALFSFAQQGRLLKGMYLQWGYNADAYTRSDIHFKLSNGDDFTLHNARAHHRPDYDDIYKHALQVSLPQYNYRLGFYLNAAKTRSVELNFDHIKYIVTDGQKVHVTGTIGGVAVNGDSILNSASFLHFEHSDGGNLLHLNYVEQKTIKWSADHKRPLFNLIAKVGAGINIPRSDFTYHGDRLNNKFHVAGYNISTEAGLRFYVSHKLFFEGIGKTGYVKYVNALANTNALKGNRAKHSFGYVEGIITIGYDIRF